MKSKRKTLLIYQKSRIIIIDIKDNDIGVVLYAIRFNLISIDEI